MTSDPITRGVPTRGILSAHRAANYFRQGRREAAAGHSRTISQGAGRTTYVAQGLILGASASLASFSQFAARANQ
jgi:hypothetical protein